MNSNDTIKFGQAEAPKGKLLKGGVIGAIIGIPAPIVGPIVGGLIGAAYMWSKHKRTRL